MTDCDRVLPALSVAEHVSVFAPTELVTTGPQLCESTPDSESVAFAEAVCVPLRRIGWGVIVGLRFGAVLSTLMFPSESESRIVRVVLARSVGSLVGALGRNHILDGRSNDSG